MLYPVIAVLCTVCGRMEKRKTLKKKSSENIFLVDGVPSNKLSDQQLVDHIQKLQDIIGREREDRNYFQLERDNIEDLMEAATKEIKKNREKIKQKEKDYETKAIAFQERIKTFKQRVKEFEHQKEVMTGKISDDIPKCVNFDREASRIKEQHLLRTTESLKIELRKTNEHYAKIIEDAKELHRKNLKALETALEEEEKYRERKLRETYSSIREKILVQNRRMLSHCEEIAGIEINRYKQRNLKLLDEVKNFKNEKTLNLLSTIVAMKEKIGKQDIGMEHDEKEITKMKEENQHIIICLQSIRAEIQKWKEKLGPSEKVKISLEAACKEAINSNNEMDKLKLRLFNLREIYERGVEEKKDLENNSNATIQSVYGHISLKIKILETKLANLAANNTH